MRISSREYKVYFDPNVAGACFGTHGVDGHENCGPAVVIGTKNKDLRFVASNMLHEIVEGILCEDDRRWDHGSWGDDSNRKLFVFDHDYLCDFQAKLIDSILSSGFFKLIDGRPKKMAKKGGKKKGKGCK